MSVILATALSGACVNQICTLAGLPATTASAAGSDFVSFMCANTVTLNVISSAAATPIAIRLVMGPTSVRYSRGATSFVPAAN